MLKSKRLMMPPDSVSGPLTVSVPAAPMPLPGERFAPEFSVGARPRLPPPPRVPPPSTVTGLWPRLPLTSSVPLLTVVAPVKLFVLSRVSVPAPARFNVIAPASEPVPPKT